MASNAPRPSSFGRVERPAWAHTQTPPEEPQPDVARPLHENGFVPPEEHEPEAVARPLPLPPEREAPPPEREPEAAKPPGFMDRLIDEPELEYDAPGFDVEPFDIGDFDVEEPEHTPPKMVAPEFEFDAGSPDELDDPDAPDGPPAPSAPPSGVAPNPTGSEPPAEQQGHPAVIAWQDGEVAYRWDVRTDRVRAFHNPADKAKSGEVAVVERTPEPPPRRKRQVHIGSGLLELSSTGRTRFWRDPHERRRPHDGSTPRPARGL